jgi:tetratricopeptide (TPR) repeat protein
MIGSKKLLVGLGGLAIAFLPSMTALAENSAGKTNASTNTGGTPAGTTNNTNTTNTTTATTPAATNAPAANNPAATNIPASANTPAATNTSTAAANPDVPAPGEKIERLLYKPGQTISTGMQTEDIVVTEDIELAKEQVAHFPDSPEASFILACALTRTSMVEEALKEVRRARRLAEAKGGPQYFDKMIKAYEDMLEMYPDDNRIRYGLAWAYYMKAYVLEKYSKPATVPRQAAVPTGPAPNAMPGQSTVTAAVPTNPVPGQTTNPPTTTSTPPATQAALPWQNQWVGALATATTGVKNLGGNPDNLLPHIPDVMSKAPPEMRPQLKMYFEAALKNLDDLLKRNPNDVWSLVYRAFLRAEYTGNLDDSMKVWRACKNRYPDNPAPYFFLGEGYLKQGNLKESLQNISRAIALRALGK